MLLWCISDKSAIYVRLLKPGCVRRSGGIFPDIRDQRIYFYFLIQVLKSIYVQYGLQGQTAPFVEMGARVLRVLYSLTKVVLAVRSILLVLS